MKLISFTNDAASEKWSIYYSILISNGYSGAYAKYKEKHYLIRLNGELMALKTNIAPSAPWLFGNVGFLNNENHKS